MTTWLDPSITPEPGTACADGSRLLMTDDMATASSPCPHCGHPNCWPLRPCTLCQHEIRIQNIERTIPRAR